LLKTPVFGAPALAACFAINRRIGRPFPDGWIPVVAVSGVLGQLVISVYLVWTASENLRNVFFWDLLSIPHGLVAGAVVGTVFWVTLHATGRKAEPA
jgi:hypothetical protein